MARKKKKKKLQWVQIQTGKFWSLMLDKGVIEITLQHGVCYIPRRTYVEMGWTAEFHGPLQSFSSKVWLSRLKPETAQARAEKWARKEVLRLSKVFDRALGSLAAKFHADQRNSGVWDRPRV